MAKKPLVSVIIVNYNGQSFLKTCLESVENQTLPRSKYEVIVVDNNSTDGSVKYIQNHFPKVSVVKSDINLGFAAGNNLGVKHAQGKYVVLLNNDTRVRNNWLKPLIETLESDKLIASVNSKALLATPFIPITVSTKYEDENLQLEISVTSNEDQHLLLTRVRSTSPDSHTSLKKNRAIITTNVSSVDLLLPCSANSSLTEYSLSVQTGSKEVEASVKVGDSSLMKKQQPLTLSLDPNKETSSLVFQVQNAGNILFKTGHSRDRGAVVGDGIQYYETDNSYFNQSTELTALCGVSVALRKEAFQQVGGFDSSLFMYYEDIDLSLKLRKQGYKLMYEPKSELFHHHAGSSKEWSSFFTYHVEKNHLAVVAKHFPLKTRVSQFTTYLVMTVLSIMRVLKSAFKFDHSKTRHWMARSRTRVAVLTWLFVKSPSFFIYRQKSRHFSQTTYQLQATHY